MYVVKIGGTGGVEADNVLDDVADVDEDCVVVHGGSEAVDSLGERLGVPPRYVESPSGVESRYTDEEAMEVFTLAMAGVNADLTLGLQRRDVDAVGLSGVDGRLLEGERKDTVIAVEDGRKRVLRGDHSGKIENVNADLLRGLVDDGYTPVVGVPMVTYDDVAVNADADRAAAAVAGALDARLLLLTDVPGVLRDVDDRDSLLREVGRDDVDDVLERYAVGRMKKKVLAAREALDSGAPAASISSANDDEPVRHALEGGGTVFTA